VATQPGPRDWWLAFEPVHAVVYFDDGCRRSMADIGLRGFWMGYFAGRAAPFGPVGPEVVASTFANFHPAMVRRAIPDAWSRVDPDRIWAARRTGAADCLRRTVPDVDARAARMVPLLDRLVDAADATGRPLFAATRAVPPPDDPVEALWQGCTGLREHRGDGHVAAVVASGLDGIESLVLFAASEGLPEALFLAGRGWSAAEWADAAGRLRARGLLDAAGASAEGIRLRRSVEATTDQQAARPFDVLDEDERLRLWEDLGWVAHGVHRAAVLTYPNPMGLPEPPVR
jgi:hypothetical protein